MESQKSRIEQDVMKSEDMMTSQVLTSQVLTSQLMMSHQPESSWQSEHHPAVVAPQHLGTRVRTSSRGNVHHETEREDIRVEGQSN